MKKYKCTPELRQRLYSIREALGLSQREIGRKMGLSNSYYGRLEIGARDISEAAVTAICNAFDVRRAYLLSGELPMFNKDDATLKKINEIYHGLLEPYKDCLFDYAEFLLARSKKREADE